MTTRLVIEVDAAGRVTVSGPIENKVVCFGLLEVAKDAIREHAEQAQKLVVPAAGMWIVPPNGQG